jgi:iron complex transport system permease protein
MAVSLLIGPSDIAGPFDVFHWIGAHLGLSPPLAASEESLIRTVVWEVRLPRILLAFMVGAALTVSGNSLQALFRNPLVSPDILGLAAGAAFGAALSVSLGYLPLQTTAFCFGLLAVGLSYFLALRRQGVSIVSLILAGVIVSGIFTALLTIVQFLTDPFKLQTIVHWTMGNLHHADWMKVRSSALPILLGLAWLMVIRWRLNVIALGDEETRTA